MGDSSLSCKTGFFVSNCGGGLESLPSFRDDFFFRLRLDSASSDCAEKQLSVKKHYFTDYVINTSSEGVVLSDSELEWCRFLRFLRFSFLRFCTPNTQRQKLVLERRLVLFTRFFLSVVSASLSKGEGERDLVKREKGKEFPSHSRQGK